MSKDKLTPRQQAVYDFILEYLLERQYMPSVRDICKHFDFASTRSALDHLESLCKKGWIHRDKNVARGLRLVEKEKA